MSYIGKQLHEISRQTTAVTSGTLADGSKVVVNSNGTVSAVAEANAVFNPPQVGTSAPFSAGMANGVGVTFDSNSNKVVLVYQDSANSRYGTAVVGTVSGTGISFGTPVAFNSVITNDPSPTFDSNSNKVVIAFADQTNSNHGKAIVGTVSGTGISFGSIATYESASTNMASIAFDSNLNKIVVVYRDAGNSNLTMAAVGTLSGTSISFGTPVTTGMSSFDLASLAFDSTANKMVLSFRDYNASGGYARVGTVSGTTISFGTIVQFDSANINQLASAYDPDTNKTAIFWRHSDNKGKAIVATVSGTNISFGNVAEFNGATTTARPSCVYDTNINKVVVCYTDNASAAEQFAIVGTISGTNITFGTRTSAFTDTSVVKNQHSLAFDSNSNKVVTGFRNTDASDPNNTSKNKGTAAVISTFGAVTNLTAENYIGVSNAGYASGDAATVQLAGAIDDAQSSLTPGQTYFVQPNGTLGTSAGNPSVLAGTAVSSTELVIKG